MVIKAIDYLKMGHFSFCGCSLQRLYTQMNYNNIDVDYAVLNLLNECLLLRDNQLSGSGFDFSQLNCTISYLCCL